MSKVFRAIGQFSVSFRYPIVVVWILVTIGLVRFGPSLTSVIQPFSAGFFLPAGAPSVHASDLASAIVDPSRSAILVASRPDGGQLTAADQQAVGQTESRLAGLSHVTRVRDVGPSSDGRAWQAQVEGRGAQDAAGFVSQVRGAVQGPDSGGLSFHLTGALPANQDDQGADGGSSSNLVLLFIVVLLLLTFRAALAPFVSLLPSVLVLAVSGVAIAASTRLGVQATILTQFLLAAVVLGAGTDYGLFLVFRVREEMRHGLDKRRAVVRAMETTGESIAFSGLTVIGALMVFALADIKIEVSAGPAIAIAVAIMLLAGLTLMPALIAIFGRATFWPSTLAPRTSARTGIWGRVAGAAIRRPVVTLVLSLALLGALALGTNTAKLEGLNGKVQLPPKSDSAAGNTVLKAHFPDASQAPTLLVLHFHNPVWDNPERLASAQSEAEALPNVIRVLGPTQLAPDVSVPPQTLGELHSALGPASQLPATQPPGSRVPAAQYGLYRATGQFISDDGRTLLLVANLRNGNLDDPHAVDQIPGLRADLANLARSVGAVDSGVADELAVNYDANQAGAANLSRLLPIVALMVAVLLAIVLRSLIAPTYLVATVLLSFLAAQGAVALVLVPLLGTPGVIFFLPFMLAVFLIALGSDYNILVMTRIREEAHHLPLAAAVRHAVSITGSTITTAGIILGGTFAILGVTLGTGSGGPTIEQVLFGIGIGVLLDTFIVRTLMVPAMVVLLSRWNWWPSRLARRSHRPEVDAAA
jgi:RND superfamily putative drug exporter